MSAETTSDETQRTGQRCHAERSCGPHDSGCGLPIEPGEEYRCLDCDAVMHRDCLRDHCSGDEKDALIARLQRTIQARDETFERHCAQLDREMDGLRQLVAPRSVPLVDAEPTHDLHRETVETVIARAEDEVAHTNRHDAGVARAHLSVAEVAVLLGELVRLENEVSRSVPPVDAEPVGCPECDETGVTFRIGGGRDNGVIEVEQPCEACGGTGVVRDCPSRDAPEGGR